MSARDRSRSGPSGWAAYNRARSALCCRVRRRPAAAASSRPTLPYMAPVSAADSAAAELPSGAIAVDVASSMAIAGGGSAGAAAGDLPSCAIAGDVPSSMAIAGGGSAVPAAGSIDADVAGVPGAVSALVPIGSGQGGFSETMQGGNDVTPDMLERFRLALREELRIYASRPRVDVGVQVGPPMSEVRHAAVGEHLTGEPILWRGIFDVP